MPSATEALVSPIDLFNPDPLFDRLEKFNMRYSDLINNGAEVSSKLESVFVLCGYASTIGQHAAHIQEKPRLEKRCAAAAKAFDDGRGMLNAVRFIFPYAQLPTLTWLYEQYTDADVIAAEGKNKPWVVKDGWKLKEENGELVKDKDGKPVYVKRDWMDVVVFILVLVARTLSPLTFFHSKGVINLKHHARRLGTVSIACWGTIISLGFVQSIRDLCNATKDIAQKFWNFISSLLDLVSFPCDCGFLMNGPPTLAVVGASLNVGASFVTLVKYVYYY